MLGGCLGFRTAHGHFTLTARVILAKVKNGYAFEVIQRAPELRLDRPRTAWDAVTRTSR